MARVDQRMLKQLAKKLGITERAVNLRIAEKIRTSFMDRRHAAMAVALDAGMNISRYTTPDDWAVLRQHRTGAGAVAPVWHSPVTATQATAAVAKRGRAPGRKQEPKNTVFVIHGRNAALRDSLHSFLRSLRLDPIEWSHGLRLVRKGSASIPEIVDAIFQRAAALVVLISPDDDAKLKRRFWTADEEEYEKTLTGQARPNVLFEAGMAMARRPKSTILVQVGMVKPFSDIAGRHILRLSDSKEKRKEFIIKLQAAGCTPDDSGTGWMNAGTFSV